MSLFGPTAAIFLLRSRNRSRALRIWSSWTSHIYHHPASRRCANFLCETKPEMLMPPPTQLAACNQSHDKQRHCWEEDGLHNEMTPELRCSQHVCAASLVFASPPPPASASQCIGCVRVHTKRYLGAERPTSQPKSSLNDKYPSNGSENHIIVLKTEHLWT